MDFDFQHPDQIVPDPPPRSRRKRWIAFGAASLLGVLLLLAGPEIYRAINPPPPPEPPPAPEIRQRVIRSSIVSGETLGALFGRYLPAQETHELTQKIRPYFSPKDLCAGQPYQVCVTGDTFDRFEYDINRDEQLIITRRGEDFHVSRVPIPYEVRTERVRGVINSSLFETINSIGEEDSLALLLADIFAYDVDFILDIREGDSFQALVEKRYRDGKPAGYGRLLAAEFTNQRQTYQAIRFRDGTRPEAYYAPDGQSRRQQFLRAPLEFSRISSGFTMRRFHPIAKTWRAHPAIDYAAPTGTPIRSVGDGTVIAKSHSGGNGNFVKIRHNNGYETMYLHMSRHGKIRQGGRVAQGQVIGYVGSTGLATGPHLCYRMTRNGAPINPNKVRSIAAEPISKANLAAFRTQAMTMLAQLADRSTQVAGDSTGSAALRTN
ncbi:MAG: M23 family metallopeptidase [Desulfuromonadales bacterium]|nr:M23 family metallopeptidase [Desulfuromonadales bacterium]